MILPQRTVRLADDCHLLALQSPPNRYSQYLRFRTLEDKGVLSQKLFWIAIFSAFVIANASTTKISGAVLRVLEVLSDTLAKNQLTLNGDMQRASQQITEHVF